MSRKPDKALLELQQLNKDIFYAIEKQNFFALDELVWIRKKEYNIPFSDIYNSDGTSLLSFAVKFGDVKILKLISDNYSLEAIKETTDKKEGGSTAPILALTKDRREAVDFFIRRGCYNIEENLDPTLDGDERDLEGDDSNKAILHLIKTRELNTLLSKGKPTFESVNRLVGKGAVLTNSMLQAYIARRLIEEDPAEIEKILRLIIEKGSKVNHKFQDAGGKMMTPLQKAVNSIVFVAASGDEVVDKRSTHVAIALLKNSAGFNLDEAQKTNLVRGILKHNPEYIKTLLAKGWIKRNFKIDGLELDNYAAKVGVEQSLVEFIARQPLSQDLIYKKKRKALKEDIFLQDAEIAAKDLAQNLEGDLVPGINTSKGIDFSTIQEDGRTKKFLEKKQDSAAQHFGNQLLRVLSNGQYVVKRGALVQRLGEAYHFATKWDDSIVGNYFLENSAPKKTEDREFLKNYARLCGVIQVLGENDWNPLNFLKSGKNGKPVKIDNSPLINGYTGSAQKRIYGSYQSKVFLHFLAGESLDGGSKSSIAKILTKLKSASKSSADEDKVSENEAKIYIDEYKDGLDDKLLERIKRNIVKNPDLKAAFIEFMAGVQDSIDLAADEQFLKEYSEKYKEAGDDAFEDTKTCRKFLQQNAREAQQQFAKYIAYYKELAPQRFAKKARNIVDEVVEEFAQVASRAGSGEERISEIVELFEEKGLDINAKINRGGKVSSLLQYTLDAINITKKDISFENVFIAVTLIKNGIKFNDLTNQQKSKLVRGCLKHCPQYFKELLDKGVIDEKLEIEKIENGIVKKTPLKKYVAALTNVPPEVRSIFDPVKAVVVRPAVLAPKALVAKPAALAPKVSPRTAPVLPPVAKSSQAVAPKAVAAKVPAAISRSSSDSGVSSVSSQTIAKPNLDFALKRAAAHKHTLAAGDNEASVLAKFSSACEKIARFKKANSGASNEEIVKALWPAAVVQVVNGKKIIRPQTPKPGQLSEREQVALSMVTLFLVNKEVNEGALQTTESKTQVFANLEKVGDTAIKEWLDGKASKSKPSPKPSSPHLDKKFDLRNNPALGHA